MSFFKEFREFAMRGNVVDLAIGIIIGGAFGKITSSLVSDILMPPLGYVLGGDAFTGLKVTLPAIGDTVKAVTINYGTFLQAVVDFTLVAFAMFLLVKVMNRIRRTEPPAPPAPTVDQKLLTEIRDLLKTQRA